MSDPDSLPPGSAEQKLIESEICVTCGFCCDGTLFEGAVAGPDDTTASLIHIGLTPVDAAPNRKRGFKLPCPHFTGLCSIYASPKPSICGQFRCRLLRSVRQGKYSVAQALSIVREVKVMRKALLPGLDAMCADLPETGAGADIQAMSLPARLRKLMPMLASPEAGWFREKHGRLLLTAFHLTSRLTNDFLPKPGRVAARNPSSEKEERA